MEEDVGADGWREGLEGLKELLGPVFGRSETRWSAGAFVEGVLSGTARKTGWMLAEAAGLERPKRMQSLLGRSLWSADEAQGVVRSYALEALGEADGVLIVDETGFLKQGKASVGVARQYSGTAGRMENAQVGVFVAYASAYGSALIDRRLYLPKAWAEDEARRAGAHVPQEIAFATKIAIAGDLIEAALDAGAPCRWVLIGSPSEFAAQIQMGAPDAAYGGSYELCKRLQDRGQGYVMAIPSNPSIAALGGLIPVQAEARELAAALSPSQWTELSAGEGSKGQRLALWARLEVPWVAAQGMAHWLLMRRSRSEPQKTAYYLAFGPAETSVADLAAAAGRRWAIEECFARAKTDLGLDHCEARSWHGWHRHMTLGGAPSDAHAHLKGSPVMAAAAVLANIAARLRKEALKKTMQDQGRAFSLPSRPCAPPSPLWPRSDA